MKKQKEHSTRKSLKTAFIFLACVTLVILISLTVKFFILLSQSTFDGQHQYNLSIIESNKKVKIISFAPDTVSLSLLQIENVPENANIGKLLAVPIDAQVWTNKEESAANTAALMKDILIHFGKYKTRGMTIVDVLRLYLYARSIPSSSTHVASLVIPFTDSQGSSTIPLLFTDHTMYHEGFTISVVNATHVSGIGAKLAKLITNMGGNVISVTSSEKQERTSTITYSGTNQSYTLQRLKKVLGFNTNAVKYTSLSDMIITIGEGSTSFF